MTDQEVNAVVMPQAVRVPARLDYRKLDPYAVRIWVQLRPLRWTGWVFARDLLAGGLKERCGDGDMHVTSWAPQRPIEILIGEQFRGILMPIREYKVNAAPIYVAPHEKAKAA